MPALFLNAVCVSTGIGGSAAGIALQSATRLIQPQVDVYICCVCGRLEWLVIVPLRLSEPAREVHMHRPAERRLEPIECPRCNMLVPRHMLGC